ncbi:MAG: hypothetical protein AAF718_13915 [Pseudomonadota bacterium]
MQNGQSALEVSNGLLEQSGAAMEAGDFDAFLSCFSLPFVIETFAGKQLHRNRLEMKAVFDAVRDYRKAHAIVETVRENVNAEYVDEKTIAATHVSRMLQEGHILFGRPYAAYSVVKWEDKAWRIQYCQYALEDNAQLNAALHARK